jgi:hypothetical protein
MDTIFEVLLLSIKRKLKIMETETFKSKYDYPVYIVEDEEIKETTMKEYLETYWNDETTTPEGVANRTQVRAILVDRNGGLLNYNRYEENLDPSYYKDEDDRWTPDIKYGTFTWRGAWGNYPFMWNGDEYNSWEEAYESILNKFYRDYRTKSNCAPIVYMSKEEAEQGLKEEVFYRKFGYYPDILEIKNLSVEDIRNLGEE